MRTIDFDGTTIYDDPDDDEYEGLTEAEILSDAIAEAQQDLWDNDWERTNPEIGNAVQAHNYRARLAIERIAIECRMARLVAQQSALVLA